MKRMLALTLLLATTASGCHLAWIDNPIPGLAGTEADGRCTQYEHLLEANGFPVEQFSRIMYRESRCNPGAINRSSGARGLLQVMPQWVTRWGGCSDLMRDAGACYPDALLDPGWNLHVAAHIYDIQGSRAWSQTR